MLTRLCPPQSRVEEGNPFLSKIYHQVFIDYNLFLNMFVIIVPHIYILSLKIISKLREMFWLIRGSLPLGDDGEKRERDNPPIHGEGKEVKEGREIERGA